MRAHPNGIELGDGGGDELRIAGPDAGLEVALAIAFHADAGAGKVRGADVGCLEVEDQHLEVHAGTQGPFQAGRQDRVPVEILPEVGPGLLGVDQADADAFFDQIGHFAEEGAGLLAAHHKDVLEIRRADPERRFHLPHAQENLRVVCFVANVPGCGLGGRGHGATVAWQTSKGNPGRKGGKL